MRNLNKLEIKIVPIKQPEPTFNKKGENYIYYGRPEYDDWVIKPDYISVREDDSSPRTVYRRIKNSTYWKIVGLKDYEFALIASLSI